MKITHITNYFMEGLNYQDTELPIHQAELKCDVSVITSERYYPFPNYYASYKKILGDRIREEGNYRFKSCDIFRLKPRFERSSSSIVILPLFRVFNLLRKLSPKVVHVHGELSFSIFAAVLYATTSNAKVFVDCHADNVNFNYKSSRNARILINIFSVAHKLLSSKITGYLPITQASSDYLQEALKIPKEKITLLPLGAKGKQPVVNEIARDIAFVYSGKITREKGVLEALKIVQGLTNRNFPHNFSFNVVGEFGDDTFKSEVLDVIQKLDYKVNLYPFLNFEKLEKIYRQSHIGMWIGTASNSIQDCACAGCIVFIGKSRTTSHLALDGELILDAGNVEDSVNKLGNLFENREKLDSLVKRSQEMINRYTWEEIAKTSVKVYQNYE
ncbi:glycosyltransferase [Enterovibrio norvegicus]|uniref:glycosyltransferase n=1 Tax=Enterovibrio norvegicus TaxID=188144 RepID=UPI0013D0B32C|nr:glycosyltransferase [Enterovibrio norvegicus]